MVKWFANRLRRLLIQEESCPVTMGLSATEGSVMSIPAVMDNKEEASKLFDEILHDRRLQARRVFLIRARPVGFQGSEIVAEVGRKYRIGIRITRTDGRIYEIYEVKRSKRTLGEPSGRMPMGGKLA
jgi:hypothetical protein